MNDFNTATLLGLITACSVVAYTILRKYLVKSHKNGLLELDDIPGPMPIPLLGTSYIFFNKNMAELYEYITNICRENYPGPIKTVLGPKKVVNVYKAEHVEALISSQQNLSKSYVYGLVKPWLGTGLLTSTGKKWHTNRKMITPAFHFKILDIFTVTFFEKTGVLIDLLKEQALIGKPFDIKPFITNCTLDILGETAMGVPLNAQKSADDEYVQAIQSISFQVVDRIFKPWLYPNIIWNLSYNGRETKRCLKILHTFTNTVIAERKNTRTIATDDPSTVCVEDDFGQKKRLAFLDVLLNATVDGRQLTNEEIREEVDTFMFEGHDTTTTAIAWVLYMLGNHEDIQEKVFKEIQDITAESDRPFTKQDITEMKYLECVIKETLRLYPSVPMIGRTLSTEVVLDKYVLPKDTEISIDVHVLHQDPRYFPNPEKFDPDRFLPENSINRHPYAYIPFSAGPRNCIGQKFAIIEEKIILASIVRHFKIHCHVKPKDFNPVALLILRAEKGCLVSLSLRK